MPVVFGPRVARWICAGLYGALVLAVMAASVASGAWLLPEVWLASLWGLALLRRSTRLNSAFWCDLWVDGSLALLPFLVWSGVC